MWNHTYILYVAFGYCGFEIIQTIIPSDSVGPQVGLIFFILEYTEKNLLKSSQTPYCQKSCNLCDQCGCRMRKKGGGGNLTELIEKNLYISSFQTRMVKKSCNICESIPKKCRFKLVKVMIFESRLEGKL